MMENYLNIAEWGEGVFGAEAAARRHFGKSARDLTRREAALLATALPNPLAPQSRPPDARGTAPLADRLLGAHGRDGALQRLPERLKARQPASPGG